MNRFIRTVSAVAASGAVAVSGVVVFAPAAFAGGKASMGCAPPFTLATIGDIDQFSQPLVTEGYFTEESLLDLLNSVDHDGDGYLCYTVPPGWNGPPATNAAHLAYFVNLVDNKVVS
jgi:hypothetical protein